MGVLEEITQMKSQGMPDEEIVKKLQDQGVAPKAINDAFNQAQIKKAISNEGGGSEESQEFEGFPAGQPQGQEGVYTPKAQEISETGMYSPQPQEQQEEYYQGSPQGDVYEYPQTGVDTNTVIEISEQVFFEKIQKIQKQIEEFSEFKTLTESRVENLSERIKKIESIIDNLQVKILEKIGGYGSNLESIKKEMSMMQNSFGKIAENVAENTKKAQKTTKKDETFSNLKKISRKK